MLNYSFVLKAELLIYLFILQDSTFLNEFKAVETERSISIPESQPVSAGGPVN